MAGAITLVTAAKNTQLDTWGDTLNSGTIKLYTSNGGTLVATCTFGSTAFAAASSGSKVANAITSGTSVAAGTMTYAEFVTSGSVTKGSCTVGTTGSNSGIEFATNVVGGAGVTVSISSLTLTHS